MMKKQPNIVLLEYSSRGILDTLFAPKIQHLLFNYVVDSIKTAVKLKKKEIIVCDINQLEISIIISSNFFIPVLNSSLEYFIRTEDYSKCAQINNLIQELEKWITN